MGKEFFGTTIEKCPKTKYLYVFRERTEFAHNGITPHRVPSRVQREAHL